ncbi:MAG: efflux RND transporter periplasmic adaptor subunit [Candidatus Eisenbacteria bacterium]|nr:efflux RND transporter periplasmic adaptor subunit [Candidatus Eisenbacteria bacterium]
MKRNCLVLIVLLMAVIVACAGCSRKANSKAKGKKDDKLMVPVEVATVTAGDIAACFTGTATISAEDETGVVAKVGGVVKQIVVEEGQYVKAGDILARLDDEKISVLLAQARANLDRLKNVYKRNADLHKQNLVSTEVYQDSQYEYEQQKAAYEITELDLKYTSIRTPISGVVAERLIKIGNMVLPNQTVFRVAGLNPLIAVLHIPERQLSKLRAGLPVQLNVDATSGERFTGHVKRISPVVDPSTGTVKITVEVGDPSRRLRPGMFARINIIYDVHQNVLKAPKDAIISEDRENAVFVVRDSVAYRQLVQTGYTNTAHVEVLTGLKPGDMVVTVGKSNLKDSTKVQIVSP